MHARGVEALREKVQVERAVYLATLREEVQVARAVYLAALRFIEAKDCNVGTEDE